MPTDNPSPGRAGAGCLIVLASIALPIAVVVFTPGPWYLGMLLGIAVLAGTFAFGGWALGKVMLITDARPAGSVPTPGPGDPVYLIGYDERDRFDCPLSGRHTPHHAFYQTVMPYLDGEGQPAEVPMSGSKWCTGQRQR